MICGACAYDSSHQGYDDHAKVQPGSRGHFWVINYCQMDRDGPEGREYEGVYTVVCPRCKSLQASKDDPRR